MQDFKARKYINQGYYKSFQPETINKQWLLTDMELIALLSKAARQLGRLDVALQKIQDAQNTNDNVLLSRGKL